MNKKLTCINCKTTCCDNFKVYTHTTGREDIPDPDKMKIGSLLEILGITVIKKDNGLWVCRAFDQIKRECKIYEYRPHLCRNYYCSLHHSKKGKKERIENIENYAEIQEMTKYHLGMSRNYELLEKEICGR